MTPSGKCSTPVPRRGVEGFFGGSHAESDKGVLGLLNPMDAVSCSKLGEVYRRRPPGICGIRGVVRLGVEMSMQHRSIVTAAQQDPDDLPVTST